MVIRYTLDGSDPDYLSDIFYVDNVMLSDVGNITLKARFQSNQPSGIFLGAILETNFTLMGTLELHMGPSDGRYGNSVDVGTSIHHIHTQ